MDQHCLSDSLRVGPGAAASVQSSGCWAGVSSCKHLGHFSCCRVLQATTKAEFSTEDVPKADRFMASKFFHVHHEFRAGKSQQWWETAQAAMAPGGGWDEAVAKNLEAGFYNHSFCPIGPEGPAFCIWEVREGITAEEFQEFIDGPNGVNFGLAAWMNICREINIEMAGSPPYPRKF